MGFLSGNRFTLSVSLRSAMSADEIAFVCEFFRVVSRILYDATDGAHSIERVFIHPDGTGSSGSDVWISDFGALHAPARLWSPGNAVQYSQAFLMYPAQMVHELGHYLYGLYDEYKGPLGQYPLQCLGDPNDPRDLKRCIMDEFRLSPSTCWVDSLSTAYPNFQTVVEAFRNGDARLRDGEPTEFCSGANHKPLVENFQNALNDLLPCWDTMADASRHGGLPFGLTAPSAFVGAADEPPLAGPDPTDCVVVIPVQRYALVLDTSADMDDASMEEVRAGADFWIDYVDPGEELAIHTTPDTPGSEFDIEAVPSGATEGDDWRRLRHEGVANYVASGVASIAEALKAALLQLTLGGRASDQVLILFTRGVETLGQPSAYDVLPDLVAAGVRVYVIGIGSDQDSVLLDALARTTGGSYDSIGGELEPDVAAAQIRDALIRIAGTSRNDSALALFEGVVGGVPESSTAALHGGALPPPVPPPDAAPEEPKTVEIPVLISPGATRVTVGASWKRSREPFTVELVDAKGEAVKKLPALRSVRTKSPYGFVVFRPDEKKGGAFSVRVTGVGVDRARIRCFAFEVNSRVRVNSHAVRSRVCPGEAVEIRTHVLIPEPVPAASHVVRVSAGGRAWMQVESRLRTEPAHGFDAPFYSAKFKTPEGVRGNYLVSIEVDVEEDRIALQLSESQVLGKAPADSRGVRRVQIDVPPVKRRSLFTVIADDREPPGPPRLLGLNSRSAWVHPEQKTLFRKAMAARARREGRRSPR